MQIFLYKAICLRKKEGIKPQVQKIGGIYLDPLFVNISFLNVCLHKMFTCLKIDTNGENMIRKTKDCESEYEELIDAFIFGYSLYKIQRPFSNNIYIILHVMAQ